MPPSMAEWPGIWQKWLDACQRQNCDCDPLLIGPPASESDIVALELELGINLPGSLREVLAQFSGDVEFQWFLPENFALPLEFKQIFSGGCSWSIDKIRQAENGRRGWVEQVFPNPEDSYDRIWHSKIGFLEVGNGDVLAISIEPDSPGEIVYLSHEDGQGHGIRLGNSFQDFIGKWSTLGCVGAEDWQMLPFLSNASEGFLTDSPQAHKWRAQMGVLL